MVKSILQIVADGSPGGGTTAVLGLCADLAASREWSVTLLTDRKSYAAEQARMIGLTVVETDFFKSRLDFRLPFHIRAAIQNVSPHIIHAHGARAGLPTSHIVPGEIPFVYTVHGFHFQKKNFIARKLGMNAEALIASRAENVIFVSAADEAIAARFKIKPRRSIIIRNGIDLSDLNFHDTVQKKYDIVLSGRLHRQKNPLFSLDVLEALPDPSTNMLVIGGGPLEEKMKDLARARGLEGRINFVGAQPRQEAIRLVRSARLFLFPSLWEGLPIAPIEALAAGVPVIGSNIDGTREVIRSGHTGILIDDFDASSYAREIQSLLNDGVRLKRMAEAGKTEVSMNFLRGQSSRSHASLYERLLGYQ